MTINYYSTNKKVEPTDFFSAILTGQAPDKGLYMPSEFPKISIDELKSLHTLEYYETASFILKKYLHEEISDDILLSYCKAAYTSFYPRLESANNNNHIMWLDEGPTASFKDYAAQMMSRFMSYKLDKSQKLIILTATSGDTGSAIAHAFHNIPNIEVVILFPLTEVSDNQRKQMTTLGGNVRAVAIKGKFDDGQAMVKEAFSDSNLSQFKLTSANSINIARLLPQSIYYFYSYSKLIENADEEVIISVPSGNFGDMMGSILAWKMGLPIKKIIVSTNANDEFPHFLKTGDYHKIVPSKTCISNAMNVGHPSNLARLIDVFGGQMDEKGIISVKPNIKEMQNLIYATSVDDELTRKTIFNTYEKEGIVLEPHGAVAWQGLMQYLKDYPEDISTTCISLETANPAKFPEEINKILNVSPKVPDSLLKIHELKEEFITIKADYNEFLKYLINEFSS